tara:strand:+ start:2046 stop:2561 length:516 start_codon:yes stop_codon:yes gene_type:complete
MKLFKILILVFTFVFGGSALFADTEDNTKKILEKAKEINEQVKKKQAEKSANIESEVGGEEPLPLNDPFVGDASLGGQSTVTVIAKTDNEDRQGLSLRNFKLVGIMTGEYESYVSLINSSGEIVTLQMNEELSPGVKLIALNPAKAVFEKGEDSYLVIDFKNIIRETSEPF